MLRFEITEHDRGAMPAFDVADEIIELGSAESAHVRLPAPVARPVHVRIDRQVWTLLAETTLGGLVRTAGDSGSIGHGIVLEFGTYQIRVSQSPLGATAAPAQRTASLARELVRSLLGDGAAPVLELERGPGAAPGSDTRRALPPPEASLVIGRGDEAGWVILDEDLSRSHAEIRRGWDGVTAADLGSKNGTRINRTAIGREPVELHDGDLLALGRVILRFRDPAEHHLRGRSSGAARFRGARRPAARLPGRTLRPRPTATIPGHFARHWPVYAFAAIAVLALAALVWILAT
jgi:hypothetical protein